MINKRRGSIILPSLENIKNENNYKVNIEHSDQIFNTFDNTENFNKCRRRFSQIYENKKNEKNFLEIDNTIENKLNINKRRKSVRKSAIYNEKPSKIFNTVDVIIPEHLKEDKSHIIKKSSEFNISENKTRFVDYYSSE